MPHSPTAVGQFTSRIALRWLSGAEAEKACAVKDANGNLLADGDHEVSYKIEGVSLGLKACFVKEA